jgi:hypothetical protein
MLLSISPLDAAEDGDTRAPQAIGLAAASCARGTVGSRMLLQGSFVVALCPVSHCRAAESVSSLAARDPRSNFRFLCLLRC